MSKDRALKEEEVRLFCSILILAEVFCEGGGFIRERVKHGTIKVVEEYKISSNFRSKVAEGAIFIYHLGFKEHLEKVKKSSLEVDVSYIILWVKEPIDGEDKESEATSFETVTPSDIVTAAVAITADIEALVPDEAQANIHSEDFANIPSLAPAVDFEEDLTKDQSSQKVNAEAS
ncbi:hypothetical protein COCNU_15G002540 [Cocos nucifera]|uniref:Uncharacterized protein n=1 Tax=Cocos nucifera TaxID=13894 RepID=A0A8K0IX32_COCNU|nr:hypothetical protein COCNU_15G002540 [Cocos nucifera]